MTLASLPAIGCIILLTAVPVAAQKVTYWENPRSPGKDLQFDTQQCNQYGQAYASRMMGAHSGASVPNTPVGQLLAGVYRLTSQAVLQKHFDSGFDSCMGALGWRKVSDGEQVQRVQQETQQQLQAEQAQRAASAEYEKSLRRFLNAKPQLNVHGYDEFEQVSHSGTTYTHIPNEQRILGFVGGFDVFIPKDPNRPIVGVIGFRTFSEAPVVGHAPTVILIVDGGDPVRVDSHNVSYSIETGEDGTARENVSVFLAPEDFRGISAASRVRVRVGRVEFTYPDGHVAAMRSLAASYLSPSRSQSKAPGQKQ